jgi:hypothetical protein
MKENNPNTEKLKRDLEDASETLKGLVDELRLQAHLGAMELEQRSGPVIDEVRAATHDIVERGKQLRNRLKTLREQRR